MKIIILLLAIMAIFEGFAAEPGEKATSGGRSSGRGRERIRTVHQDITKWDKNKDGKLTGSEKDEFVKAKRKEFSDAAKAARLAKGNGKPQEVKPVKHPELSAEALGKPVKRGVPKNIENAAE